MEQPKEARHFCKFCGIRREEMPPSETKVMKRRRGSRKASAYGAGQSLRTSPFDRSSDVLLTSRVRVTEDAGTSSDNYVASQHSLAGLGGLNHFKTQFLTQDETSDMAAFLHRPSTTCCHHNPLTFLTTPSRTLNFSRFPCLLLVAVGALLQVLTANAAPILGEIEITALTPSSMLATPNSFNYEFPPPSYHNAQDPLTPATRVRRTSPQNTGPAHMGLHDQPQRLYSKHGFYIEIRKNGKVKGSRKLTSKSVMEIKSGGRGGLVVIQSKKSKRYLAMDKNGKITGLKTFNKATCIFQEEMIENNHFVYFQEKRRGRKSAVNRLYLGFDRNGKPKRGKKVQRNSTKAHFLKVAAKVKKTKRRGRRRVGKNKNKKNART